MSTPEEALQNARESAERKRAAGGYPEGGPGALEDSIVSDRPNLDLLSEWAVIEVDSRNVYSTRAVGAPITLLKRILVRLLRQYTVELEARQTRFNIALLSHFQELEARVAQLERGHRE